MRNLIAYSIIILLTVAALYAIAVKGEIVLSHYIESMSQHGYIFISGFLLSGILIHNRFNFFANFLHESTHLVFAMVFFLQIGQFYVSQSGGEVQIKSGKKNVLIGLAPYFLPIVTLIFIALPGTESSVRELVVFASYGFFWGRNFLQIQKHNKELFEFSWYGLVLVVVANFWISLSILTQDICVLNQIFEFNL